VVVLITPFGFEYNQDKEIYSSAFLPVFLGRSTL